MILLLIPFLLFDGTFLIRLTASKRYALAGTYFSVTRILAVIGLAFYYFHSLASLTSATSDGGFVLYGSVAYTLLTALTAFTAFYSKVKRKLSLATLCVSIAGLITFAFLYFGIGPNVKNPNSALAGSIVRSRQDQQTARDLQLIDGCISIDIATDNKLPPTMQAAIAEDGGESPDGCTAGEGVGRRLNNYTYKPLADLGFQLCATFYTRVSEPSSIGNSTKADNHGKGYQCFTYDQYGF